MSEVIVDLMKGEHYKYLADKVNSPAYGYGVIYPQIFAHNKRPTDAAQQACLEWSRERAQNWLKLPDQHWLGPRASYLCGERITIADLRLSRSR